MWSFIRRIKKRKREVFTRKTRCCYDTCKIQLSCENLHYFHNAVISGPKIFPECHSENGLIMKVIRVGVTEIMFL